MISGDYDERCDIWSAGVMLYILLTALPPFDGDDDKDIINNVKKLNYSFDRKSMSDYLVPEMENVSK